MLEWKPSNETAIEFRFNFLVVREFNIRIARVYILFEGYEWLQNKIGKLADVVTTTKVSDG